MAKLKRFANSMRVEVKPAQIEYRDKVVGFGSPELWVELIPVWLARLVIKAHHYSGTVVNNSYFHLGVFSHRELVGVMQWGYALQPASGRNVVAGTGNREYMELNRLWVHDKMPRNTESRVMSYAIKLIKRLHPQVQWLQTFADSRCGRAGVTYQACNFKYLGSHMADFYELDGQWYHHIAMSRSQKAGVRGAFLRANKHRAIKHSFPQYRYIYFINKHAEKRLNARRFKVQAYPKHGG